MAKNQYLDYEGLTYFKEKMEELAPADMTAATSTTDGTHGLVPAPAKGNQGKYLRGDGTWQTPTNTKNSAGTTNKINEKMFLVGATAQSSNPTTYSNVNCYIGEDNCLYSNGEKVATTTGTFRVNSDGSVTLVFPD